MSEFDALAGSRPVSADRVPMAVLSAALLAALLHPQSIGEWMNGLPVHPLAESAIGFAERWQAWCTDAGLGGYFKYLRTGVQMLRECLW
jgi:hypothetical protein